MYEESSPTDIPSESLYSGPDTKPNISQSEGFSRLAPVYDQLAQFIFGSAIRQSQFATLPHIPADASVLIIGGGTGWFLRELLQKTNPKRVVYIEVSSRMLALSQQHNRSPIVEFRLGTEETILPTEQFDVIITHFLLDLYPQAYVENFIQGQRGNLSDQGIWLCADFEVSHESGSRWWKTGLIACMYAFFRCFCRIKARTLPNYDRAFHLAGLHCSYEKRFFHQMITSRVYHPVDSKTIIQ